MANRNAESIFATNPTNIDIQRSKFERPHELKTSFNVGDVIPILIDEVLPGDTVSLHTSKVIRAQTMITPIMDNLYYDEYFFFCPSRLVWEHWKQFMGENTESAWIPQTTYEIPQLEAPQGGWQIGSLADYFGIPTGIDGFSVNALPFRAYALIMNEWFRDQNLTDPLNISVDDTTRTGTNGTDYITDVQLGGAPFKAAKYHDYFTSALPGPQKGPDVALSLTGDLNVFGNGKTLGLTSPGSGTENVTLAGMYAKGSNDYSFEGAAGSFNTNAGSNVSSGSKINGRTVGVVTKAQLDTAEVGYDATGLIASMANATAISVNAMRLAFQVQKLYEKMARSGSRYVEVIKGHFGVVSPDSRLQRPEYLGGKRVPIVVHQVTQTSASESGISPQGTTTAFSLTSDSNFDFTQSFTEHGFIIGVGVIRYRHTYQQGLKKLWSKKDKLDFYWPVLANIGEQPIRMKELYLTGTSADDNVFGYQEAWAEYRYYPSYCTAEMRSQAPQSLDVWHLADDYQSAPSLSDSWIREDKSNVDRVLAVTSAVSNQFFGDFYFDMTCVRPMPMYSIPGLLDHH